uniref:Uncharacterized protein n=1 Tax=Arundo donax TaxID=35708 RepID=A0A0A9A5N1_ARUDO
MLHLLHLVLALQILPVHLNSEASFDIYCSNLCMRALV